MKSDHPMLLRLAERYPQLSVYAAIENEALRLRQLHQDQLFFKSQAAKKVLDVRQLAHMHGMEEVRLNRPVSVCNASTGLQDGRLVYSISPDERGRLPHPFQQRFLIAHEVAHVALRSSLGPFSPGELVFSQIEESLCDLLAHALLIPAGDLKLPKDGLHKDQVYQWCQQFQTPLSMTLARMAGLNDALLLLWDWCRQPKKPRDPATYRILDVFPKGVGLTRHFVPFYCTARDERFSPNLVKLALEEGACNHGLVHVQKLGSLNPRRYLLHNLFFKAPKPDLFPEQTKRRWKSFNMATLIQRHQAKQSSFIWQSLSQASHLP